MRSIDAEVARGFDRKLAVWNKATNSETGVRH